MPSEPPSDAPTAVDVADPTDPTDPTDEPGEAGKAGKADELGDGERSERRGSGVGRVAAIGIVVGLVSMWAYVVYLAFGPGREPPVDRLDDPAFARAAEDRCAEALDQVAELPLASESPTARDRARVLGQANVVFSDLLDDLDQLAPRAPAGEQRARVHRWLADWETYLGDRSEYAVALRTDPGARLLISEKPGTGRHITGWIDEFAAANRMPSCATPTDV